MAEGAILVTRLSNSCLQGRRASISVSVRIGCTEVRAVGKRVGKKWDLPWEQGGALGVLSVCFLLGGAAGCLFAALSDEQGAQALGSYLADYLRLAQGEGLSSGLWSVLWDRLQAPLAVLVLGATAFGAIGIPILFGVEGFFLSFSVGCFGRVFGGAGLLPAFALFGLPALLWAPALFLVGVQGQQRSLALLNRGLNGGGRSSLPPFGELWPLAGLSLGLTVGCALMECWVVPVLLAACARVVL